MDAVDGIQVFNLVVVLIAFQMANIAFGFPGQIVVNMRTVYVQL